MRRARLYKRFHFYLFKELLLFFVLSLSVFTFILVLSRLGKMADLVINKGVNLKDIVLLIAYLSPPFLTFTLPMAFLLAAVVALGRLSSENEVLILKASGVNLASLFVPVAMLGIVVFTAGFLNNAFLLSKSSEAFRQTLVNVGKKQFSLEEGIFNEFPGVVIFVNKVDSRNGNLGGIVIADDRDETVRQTLTAEKGMLNLDLKTFNLSFVLKNGSLHRLQRQSDTYQSISFNDYSFQLDLTSLIPVNRNLRKAPWEMDLDELKNELAKAKKAEDRYDYSLEIYKKFAVPFSVVAFILLTVPLGVGRRSEGKFSGVVYSLLIFIAYYFLSALCENAGKFYNVSPLLVAFIPNIAFSAVGLYLAVGLNDEDRRLKFDRLKERMGRIAGRANG
jgi:lipopolysaccharide export system permease protein